MCLKESERKCVHGVCVYLNEWVDDWCVMHTINWSSSCMCLRESEEKYVHGVCVYVNEWVEIVVSCTL